MTSSTATDRAQLDAVVAEITNDPGRPGRDRVLQFGGSQLDQVLGDLRREGVDAPPAVDRALELDGECAQLFASPTPVTKWLDGQDLADLDGEQVIERVTEHAWRVQVGDRRGEYARQVAAWLLQRAVDALAGDLDRIVGELRPTWDAAAADLAAAARAGITGSTTAEEAIEQGDQPVAAWRTVGPAVAVLDRLDQLVARLTFLCGYYVDPEVTNQRGRQHWLDSSVSGPVALAAPSERATTDTRTVRVGNHRSVIAAGLGEEITRRGDLEREAAEQTRRAYLEAERQRQFEPAATPNATDDEPRHLPGGRAPRHPRLTSTHKGDHDVRQRACPRRRPRPPACRPARRPP